MTTSIDKLETLKRGLAGNVLGRAAQMVFMLVTTVILARFLGVEGFGYYAIAVATVRVFGIPIVEGVARVCEREVSGALATGTAGIAWAAVRFNLIGTVVLVGFGAAGIVVYLQYLGEQQQLMHVSSYIGGAILLFAFEGITSGFRGIIRGEGQTAQVQIPATLITAATPLTFLAYYGVTEEISVEAALIIRGLVSGSVLPLWVWIALRHWPKEFNLLSDRIPSSWIIDAVQFALLGSIQVLANQIGVFMIGILGTAEQAGYFGIGSRVVRVVTFFSGVVRNVIGPRVAPLWRSGQVKVLETVTQDLTSLALVFAVSMSFGFVVFGKPLLNVMFGSNFDNAYGLSVVLCGAGIFMSAGGIAARLLKMSGFQTWVTVGAVVGLISAISLNFLLVPSFGAMGAATALLIAIGISQILYVVATWKQMGILVTPNLHVRTAIRRTVGQSAGRDQVG